MPTTRQLPVKRSVVPVQSTQTQVFSTGNTKTFRYNIVIPKQNTSGSTYSHVIELQGCSFKFTYYAYFETNARHSISLVKHKQCKFKWTTTIHNQNEANNYTITSHWFTPRQFLRSSMNKEKGTTIATAQFDLYNEKSGFIENNTITVDFTVRVEDIEYNSPTKRLFESFETNDSPTKKIKLTGPNYDYDEQIPDDTDVALTMAPVRKGQARFRDAAIIKYGLRCVITGTKLGVEAAHVKPYCKDRKYELNNVILLEKGLHDCFDSFRWTIVRDDTTKTLRVKLGDEMKQDDFWKRVRDKDLDGLELGWFDSALQEALYNEKTGVKNEYLNLHQQQFRK